MSANFIRQYKELQQLFVMIHLEVSVQSDVQMFRLPLCIPSTIVAKFRLRTRLFSGTFMSQQQTYKNSF